MSGTHYWRAYDHVSGEVTLACCTVRQATTANFWSTFVGNVTCKHCKATEVYKATLVAEAILRMPEAR